MRKPTLALVISGVLALVILLGLRAGQTYLAANAPQLLSKITGQEVSISEISLHVFPPAISAAEVRLGDATQPFLAASNVDLSLNWRDPFGNAYMSGVLTDSLLLNPAAWQARPESSTTPDMSLIRPWIPDEVSVGQFVLGLADKEVQLDTLQLRRADTDSVELTGNYNGRAVSLSVESLAALITRESVAARLSLDELQLAARAVQTDAGYDLNINADLAGSTLKLEAMTPALFSFPTSSRIDINRLSPAVMEWFQSFGASSAQSINLEERLSQVLPALDLPRHDAEVHIAEIDFNDADVGLLEFRMRTDADQLTLDNIVAGYRNALVKGDAVFEVGSNWEITANLQAENEKGVSPVLAARFDDGWHWVSGELAFSAEGATPAALLDSADGLFALHMEREGYRHLPVDISGDIGNGTDGLEIDDLRLKIGDAVAEGRIILPGGDDRLSLVRLDATDMNLDVLLEGETSSADMEGILIPRLAGLLAGVSLDWEIQASNLTVAGEKVKSAELQVKRSEDEGRVIMNARFSDLSSATLNADVSIDASRRAALSGEILFSALDVNDVVRDEPRTLMVDGKVTFTGAGQTLQEVISSAVADLDLGLAGEGWRNPLQLTATATTFVDENYLVGGRLDSLSLATAATKLKGEASIAIHGDPVVAVSLSTDEFDVTPLFSLPSRSESDNKTTFMDALKALPPLSLDVAADQLTWEMDKFERFELSVKNSAEAFTGRVSAAHPDGTATSTIRIGLADDAMQLQMQGEVAGLRLKRFVGPLALDKPVPLGGDFEVTGTGSSLAGLAASLAGHFNLDGPQSPDIDQRRHINVALSRDDTGARADIHQLVIGRNEVSGSLRVAPIPGDRSLVSVNLAGGSVFFQADDEAKPQDATARLFSEMPINFGVLEVVDLDVTGKLDLLETPWFNAAELTLSGERRDNRITASVAGGLNGGRGNVDLRVDAIDQAPTLSLNMELRDVTGRSEEEVSARSASIALTGEGDNLASIAGSLDGTVYMEMGRGPLAVSGLNILTGDIARTVIRSLLPGAREEQKLRCAVAMMEFSDGIGAAPFGFAAQTNRANLVGQLSLDLKKERMKVGFSSRSRRVTGLSVGDLFSNTIALDGPITKPKIVPKPGSAVLRIGAALATGGFSVLGESLFNQMINSSDPCGVVQQKVKEKYCSAESPPFVCEA